MIFLVLICFSDLIRAPMDTAAVEKEWGNGKHDSFLCLEVRCTQTVCVCVSKWWQWSLPTHCNLMQKVRLCSTLESTVSHSDQWVGVLLAFSSMYCNYHPVVLLHLCQLGSHWGCQWVKLWLASSNLGSLKLSCPVKMWELCSWKVKVWTVNKHKVNSCKAAKNQTPDPACQCFMWHFVSI